MNSPAGTQQARTSEVSRAEAATRSRFWRSMFVCAILTAFVVGAFVVGRSAYERYWPRQIAISFPIATPIPSVSHNGQLQISSPTGYLLGQLGTFSDELTAYLNFEYIRSLQQVDAQQVLLTARERNGHPVYRVFLVMSGDYLTASPELAELKAQHFITEFSIVFATRGTVDYARTQTALFLAAYSRPVRTKLESLSGAALQTNVSRFILFKAKTDRRAREQIQPLPSREDATEMAADIIAVAKFYDVPLDLFLGVGAMENNYLPVRGDLQHKVWKRHAEPGDIVLKRRRGRVLVLNYSLGVWQITRETVRYAHRLYLEDKRDYSKLPERLRPPKDLDLDGIDSHVLTTYAGLLLRNLLDRFGGDATKAIGAYNGGPNDPNLSYAEGVSTVADYARQVLQEAARMNGHAIARTRLVVRRMPG